MKDDEQTISTLLAKVAELKKVVQQQAAKQDALLFLHDPAVSFSLNPHLNPLFRQGTYRSADDSPTSG